jgi:hypothetical protein
MGLCAAALRDGRCFGGCGAVRVLLSPLEDMIVTGEELALVHKQSEERLNLESRLMTEEQVLR